jgi:hypothetical protein
MLENLACGEERSTGDASAATPEDKATSIESMLRRILPSDNKKGSHGAARERDVAVSEARETDHKDLRADVEYSTPITIMETCGVSLTLAGFKKLL